MAMPTIILLDEEDYIRELLGAVLAIEGYKVLDADKPGQAMERAFNEGPADLLLTDVLLSGGVSAPFLYSELRRKLPDLKVLYMTGFPLAAFADMRVPQEKIIFKPFTPKQLIARIESTLAAQVTA